MFTIQTSRIQPRRIILASALILSPAPLLAQDLNAPSIPNQGQSAPNTAASRSPSTQREPDSTPGPGSTAQEMQDKRFLRDLAQGGLAEVKLGQLAATKASSEDVKEFGAKMVADHAQMSRDLAPLADSMGIRLPKDLSKPDQAEYDKLSKLSGDDFDKEYITVMLDDHRKDLRAFRQESMSTNDNALHTEIDKSAAVVRDHMGIIIKLAKEKGIALPPAPATSRSHAASTTAMSNLHPNRDHRLGLGCFRVQEEQRHLPPFGLEHLFLR